MKTILVTGGAGYIGSHCIIELVQDGYEVIVVDNFSNSNRECIKRVESIIGGKSIIVHEVDICDRKALDEVFEKHAFHAVLHLAGCRGKLFETCDNPLKYYKNNVGGTINLLECMQDHGVTNLIYSSSAHVYAASKCLQLFDEESSLIGDEIQDIYAKTKCVVEHLIKDMCQIKKNLNVIVLRYFDAAGAHESGLIGEKLHEHPITLITCVSQVAAELRPFIFVADFSDQTPDGSGLRDYVHVSDIAKAHLCALKKLDDESPKWRTYNLSTGKTYSVFELIKAMEKVSGKTLNFVQRKIPPGVPAVLGVDAKLANKELDWHATKGLDDMCHDAWRWYTMNPNGYPQ